MTDQQDDEPDPDVPTTAAIRRWKERIAELRQGDRGNPRGNLFNVLQTLRNTEDWEGVLAYDEFAVRVVTKRPPPWAGTNVAKWADDHDTRACAWFQEQGINAAVGIVGRAIQTVARENPVHPVRDYLNGLRWDRTPRLDTWLVRYLGAEDSLYARAVGSRFLTSAVARIFEAGCQADHMLILEGPQGRLKSSALRAMADPWFTDRISNVGSKDAAMETAGVWLIEMSELDALTRAGNSAIKSFLTRRHDRYRPPYGTHVMERPRQCVFAGTINPAGGYLKDPTGTRRFWPVACNTVDLDALVRDRDRLWAEALVRYRAGYPWHLETPELEALAATEQAARSAYDAWEKPVREYRPSRAGQPRTPPYRREATDRSDCRKSSSAKRRGWKSMTTVTVITRFR